MATGTTETWVVDSARRILKRRGGLVDKNHQQGRGRRGRSDLVACYRGRYLALECKAPRGPRGGRRREVTEPQRLYLAAVNRAGGIGIVLDHPDTLTWMLDQLDASMLIYVDPDTLDPLVPRLGQADLTPPNHKDPA